jgi:3-oxoacyl-(acyl-carrier-protein) synthase
MSSSVAVVDFEAVTSLGLDWSSTRGALMEGKDGTESETIHDQSTRVGRVDMETEDNPRVPRYHRLARRCLVTMIERWDPFPDRSLGLVAATSTGGLGTVDVRSVVSLHNPGIWAGQLSKAFPSVKRVSAPNSACATGPTALIQASRWIRHGEVDQAIVVGAESCFNPLLTAGYRNMKALCGKSGMRPFHPDRDGFALSEGAAAVYLWGGDLIDEAPDRVKGHVRGWGETSDAHHITNLHPEGRGLNHAIDRTLDQADLERADVDLCHAHLTTTADNDRVEYDILDQWPGEPCLQGVKPALGHTIGAAGLLEAIATLDVLRNGEPFPIVNGSKKHFPVPVEVRNSLRRGLTWNMGFGGHNAALLIESTP